MNDITPTLRLHMWLETDQGQVLGLGRILLLEQIRKQGSLNKAAKALAMSYRAAWGRLKTAEEQIGRPLTAQPEGRKGFVLTPFAEQIIDEFRAWYDDVEAYALEKARSHFDWTIKPYEDTP